MARGYLCVECTKHDEVVEFDTMKELSDHSKGGHVSRPLGFVPPPPEVTEEQVEKIQEEKINPPPPPKAKEIKLLYKFEGQHNKCMSDVTTLELDVEKKHYVIAFCSACNEQVINREVVKL